MSERLITAHLGMPFLSKLFFFDLGLDFGEGEYFERLNRVPDNGLEISQEALL